MGRIYRVIVAFCVAIQLGACAGTSALESQSRQKDVRLARLYFLREKGILGAMGGTTPAADITINGKAVGSVTNSSYIFVDRPPGVYKLAVQSGLSMTFETEAQVEPGKEYYFNIGVQQSGKIGTDLLNQAFAGGKGEPMRAQSLLM